jgi:two-component system, OmpR family, alkaline phosphatase synthesis response regulator PhoP
MTTEPPRVLVVEDDHDIVQVVRTYLQSAGYLVEVAADGRAGLSRALAAPPSLIVLDWMLPRLDGLEFMKILRRTHGVPVIMLTARIEEADRVLGLEFGADDYVTKPFSPRELVARVRAVLRRVESGGGGGEAALERGSLRIDPGRRRVSVVGRPIDMTAREFDLLYALARSPGRVFRRDELLERAWGPEFEGIDRVVDVHVSNLRRKLDAHPESAGAIVTVRGVGYSFREARP